MELLDGIISSSKLSSRICLCDVPPKVVAAVQQKAEINKARKTENGTSVKLERAGAWQTEGLPKSRHRWNSRR